MSAAKILIPFSRPSAIQVSSLVTGLAMIEILFTGMINLSSYNHVVFVISFNFVENPV